MESPAATVLLAGFRPRTTRYFLVSTRKYPKKLAPDSAPRSVLRCGVPSLAVWLRRFAEGTSLCLPRTRRSLLRRFALALRLHGSLGLSKGGGENRDPLRSRDLNNYAAVWPIGCLPIRHKPGGALQSTDG
jgi:hypothetical protein